MSFFSFTPPVRTYGTASATAQFTPLTGWMPVIRHKYIKGVFDVQGATAEFRVQLAYQTAIADPETPDNLYTAGSEISANGKFNTGQLLPSGSNTDSKYWIRYGVVTRSSTDGTYAQGEVGLWLTTGI